MHDLDLPCWSARDLLELVGAVRGTRPRDGLRALEDALLDVMADIPETPPAHLAT